VTAMDGTIVGGSTSRVRHGHLRVRDQQAAMTGRGRRCGNWLGPLVCAYKATHVSRHVDKFRRFSGACRIARRPFCILSLEHRAAVQPS
jgi:hypothetical protein